MIYERAFARRPGVDYGNIEVSDHGVDTKPVPEGLTCVARPMVHGARRRLHVALHQHVAGDGRRHQLVRYADQRMNCKAKSTYKHKK